MEYDTRIGNTILLMKYYNRIKSDIYTVLMSDLPEEYQTIETLSFILDELKDDLNKVQINLNSDIIGGNNERKKM